MRARARVTVEEQERTDRDRNRDRDRDRSDPGRADRLRRLLGSAEGTEATPHAGRVRILPAVPAIASLLPDGGLRRGTTVAVSGSTSLALALAVGPSGAGSWCAVVGAPALGLVAAAEMGIAFERFPLIAPPGRAWTRTVAAALEAFDLVLAWPPAEGIPASEARRLSALGRERDAVLVACGGSAWPERADLRLEAVRSVWLGLERGHGRLRARCLDVVVTGRGSASIPRRSSLWLPGADGGIAMATDPAAVAVATASTSGVAIAASAG